MGSTRAKRSGERVGTLALSFDDGPDLRWTPQVLAALERAGVTATFFVRPRRAPHLIERVAFEGHEVAYHCDRHIRHSDREREEVEAEVRRDLGLLAEIGVSPRRWRTPWGDLAPWSGSLADELGLELCGWSDDPEDWAGHGHLQMLRRLETTLGPGSVVLMHDGIGPGARRSDCRETVRLIEPLVYFARARGIEPTSIENCAEVRAGVGAMP
jgi:peptidoglycan/xylan/chitin deacetylase (PgdA/CDA1 family)